MADVRLKGKLGSEPVLEWTPEKCVNKHSWFLNMRF